MSRHSLFIVKSLSWIVTSGLCWTYAARGFESPHRFDMWFWGIAFVLNLCIALVAIAEAVLER